jgi:hypothetical protein
MLIASQTAVVQREVLAGWLLWSFPPDFCLEQQLQLIRQKALGTKTVSEFVFILTVVLRVTPVVFTVGERKILRFLCICICTAVHA